MLQRTSLIFAIVCAGSTFANAQNITTFNAPIYVTPQSNPVQMGNQVMWQSMATTQQMRAQQAEMENNRLRMQTQQYQMQSAGAAIGEGIDHLAHACEPDVVRQPGVHLLARLGLCGQHRAETVAQQKVGDQTPISVPRQRARGAHRVVAR